MSLFETTARDHRPKRLPCTFALLYRELTPEDAAELRTVLADDRVWHSVIAETLTANGYRVRQITVGRHRNGKCSCGAL